MDKNTLYYGDNLDILRRYIDDESVDLIYLDPPFNSNADYNVLFAEKDGTQAHAQIKAFEDTWTWDQEAAQEYAEVLRSGHQSESMGRVAKALKGLHDFLVLVVPARCAKKNQRNAFLVFFAFFAPSR